MGIFGLTGFIDRNPHLLHKHELRNCSVVIDGNNFYHHVYRAAHIESIFGGDYDVYRQKLRTNLKSLLKCGITPYIVLDGGYTTDDRKLRKCVDRAKQRLRNVGLASKKGCCQMTPLLAYDTFIQTLDEMKIHHATCQFEADNEIAKLANKLQCPVISNDSDFYIFDLTDGFLPLDYIDFNPLYKKSSQSSKLLPFLHCHLYQVEDLIDSFEGLNKSVLPIFASLLGNDFVASNAVERVFSRMQVPKSVSRQCKLPSKLSKIIKLLHWLEVRSEGSVNILDKILPFIESKRQFMTSVEGYFKISDFEGSDLHQFFTHSIEEFQPRAASTFNGYNGSHFPKWFLTAICKGKIPPSVINAAVLHRVIFLSQVEKLESPSAHDCSQFLRQILCGILLKSDPPQECKILSHNKSVEDGQSKDFFSEFLDAVEKSASAEKDVSKGSAIRSSSYELSNNLVTGSCADFSSNIENDEISQSCASEDENYENVSKDEDGKDEELILHEEVKESYRSVKQKQFEEYHREGKKVKKRFLEPVLLIEGKSLPTLTDIEFLLHDRRLYILMKSLDTDSIFINLFSSDLSLFMVSVVSWIKHADPKITEHHLDCVILCLILLHMESVRDRGNDKGDDCKKKFKLDNSEINNVSNPLDSIDMKAESTVNIIETDDVIESNSCIDLQQICFEEKDSKKFINAIDNLDKYRQFKPDFSRRTIAFESEIVHAFAQLQCLVYEISNLNKILRFPMPAIKPAMFFNGSFLYNFYVDLISRLKPSDFIEAMLFKNSCMHTMFLRIKSVICDSVGSANFATLGHGLKKRKKKSKGKRKRKISASESEKIAKEDNEKEESVDEVEENMEEVIAIQGFDVHNKFSLLSL